jgi:hypothetical protein
MANNTLLKDFKRTGKQKAKKNFNMLKALPIQILLKVINIDPTLRSCI